MNEFEKVINLNYTYTRLAVSLAHINENLFYSFPGELYIDLIQSIN